MRQIVRGLRRSPTPVERMMWAILRDRSWRGLKFRRQFPIGPFVVDFCCYELRLVIELDGEVHREAQQAAKDVERGAYLQALGYTVLRFRNREIFSDREAVLAQIMATAQRKAWV